VCKGEKGGIGKKDEKKNIAIHLKAICDAAWGQIKSGDIKKPFLSFWRLLSFQHPKTSVSFFSTCTGKKKTRKISCSHR
jgi:hypothetical protein